MNVKYSEIDISGSIEYDLECAERFRREKRNFARTLHLYQNALAACLCEAVNSARDFKRGQRLMTARGAQDILKKIEVQIQDILEEKASDAVIYYYLTLSIHCAWLLEEHKMAEDLVSHLNKDFLKPPVGSFWRAYGDGMFAVANHQHFTSTISKDLIDAQIYWIKYIDLMSAVCNFQDTSLLAKSVAKSFIDRNRDCGLGIEELPVEGNGNQPVNWDYRAVSLQKFIFHSYGEEVVSSWPFLEVN